MVTLHVAKETSRVVENRQRNRISFGIFRKGLLRVYEYDLAALAGFPKNYWHDQYESWCSGDRSANIHDSTIKAIEWAERAYGAGCDHA
jgi:hypothetical protein